MWVVVRSDGDIDYVNVYGLFGSEKAALEACPEDDDSYSYRVFILEDIKQII